MGYFDEPTEVEILDAREWYVRRYGQITEMEEGGRIRFRVQIWDAGRQPFVTQWFNDLAPALDFLEGVQIENQRYHEIRKEA